MIWGGTSGIGAALAKRYFTMSKLSHITVIGREEEKFKENFKGQFQRIKYVPCDITHISSVKACIEAELKEGPIDLYVISSGIGIDDKKKLEDFHISRRIFEVNTIGTLNAVEAVLPSMYENQSGHIVLIGSIAGVRGLAGNAAYCASKAAIHSLGESWSKTLKDEGINVTTIAPGFVDTPHTQNNTHDMPFIMNPRDVAQMIQEAIDRNESFVAFPKISYFTMKVLSFLPLGISNKLLKMINIY